MPSTPTVKTGELRAIPVLGIRDVFAGDSVASLIVDALAFGGLCFHDGDILVVKHKIVSKAEGRRVEMCIRDRSYSAPVRRPACCPACNRTCRS